MIKAEDIEIVVASEKTVKYVDEILDTITRAAKVRGTGIAKRSPEYVKQKMLENKAVRRNIATLRSDGTEFVEPEEGLLACGCDGKGRLASVEKILKTLQRALEQ